MRKATSFWLLSLQLSKVIHPHHLKPARLLSEWHRQHYLLTLQNKILLNESF